MTIPVARWPILLASLFGCHSATRQPDDASRLLSEVMARGPGCEHCTIEFELLGRLGGPADTVLLGRESMIQLRDDGAYVAAPTLQDDGAAIFDSLGAVARPYGVAGDGPGEYGRVLNVLPWSGDSVLLAGFDRFTILGGARGQGRSVPLAQVSAGPGAVALPAEGMVVRNFPRPPYREIVVFNGDGTLRVEIGPPRPSASGGDVYASTEELGPSRRPHTFWSAPQRYRIQIDLWDARDGAHLKQFQDTVPWYAPFDSASTIDFLMAGNDMANPPPPALRGIHESRTAGLWLLYNVAARDWARTDDGSPPLQRHPRPEAYDAVLDLRDPVSGQTLLTTWSTCLWRKSSMTHCWSIDMRRRMASGWRVCTRWCFGGEVVFRTGFPLQDAVA